MKHSVCYNVIYSGFVDIEIPDDTAVEDIEEALEDGLYAIPLNTLIQEADDYHREVASYD
jgi:hypothetical protein